MIHIAICDDDEVIVRYLNRIIENLLIKHYPSIDFTMHQFTSGKDLLAQMETIEYNIVFLDYDMPNINGIEVGKIIRTTLPKSVLVMATAMTECINDSFRIHANRFLLKPFNENDILEALSYAIMRFEKPFYRFSISDLEYSIPKESIVKIKGSYGMSDIYTVSDTYHRSMSLVKVEEEIDYEHLFRINRNCVVNLDYVKRINKKYYLNEEKLNISRYKIKEFHEKYMEYNIHKG